MSASPTDSSSFSHTSSSSNSGYSAVNSYGYDLNHGGNIVFLTAFSIILGFNAIMCIWSRYHWYNISFICGYVLQVAGFAGRVLSFHNTTNQNYYLLQLVALTISPAFIMAGVYFIFAQMVVMYGKSYSVLKPMWYSYFFIATDFLSLIIQGAGGGIASSATSQHKSARSGTWIMFGGILIQIVAMTIFVIFWVEFLHRLYFKDRTRVYDDHPMKKRTIFNIIRFLCNSKSAQAYREEHVEPLLDPRYHHLRQRVLVPYLPLAMTTAVILVYTRCIYRVVELKQGFEGYLATHEAYILVLDATMIAIAGFIFMAFHPMLVFGRENILRLAAIKGKDEEQQPQMPLEKSVQDEDYEMKEFDRIEQEARNLL